jgi:hypothetical protein
MKIQVKTIWSDRTNVRVELPAAERLARWDYPSFIVILRMNMDRTYRDIYCIHLLDDNLARILKVLRKAEADGSLSIKGKTISFGIRDGIRIPVDGPELAKALNSAVGIDPDAYVARKGEQRRNLGFSEKRYSFTFSIAENSENDFLDILLGLRKANFSRFDADEVRFDLPLPLIRESEGILTIQPKSHGPCEFVVTSSVGDRKRAIFPAELYMANATMTSCGPWKARIHSPAIEMHFASDDSKGTFTIGSEPDTRLTVADSIRVWRAAFIIASGHSTAFVRMGGRRLVEFNINESPCLAKQRVLAARIEFLSDLERILSEIDLQDIALNNDDIESNIECINFVLKSQRAENDVEIALRLRARNEAPFMQDCTDGLFSSKITFPGVVVVFRASMRITAKPDNEAIALRCSDFHLRDIAVLGADQTFDEFVAEASAISGLSFVLQTEKLMYSSGCSQPEAADDDGYKGELAH